MKTCFTRQSMIIVALVAVPFISGCTRQSTSNPPTYVTTSTTSPVVVSVAPVPATVVEQPADPAPAVAAPETAPPLIIANAAAEPVWPANLRVSKPLNEVIRLVQSGVDESVILTFVTNSPAVFTVGAEEIVYLNDLGVSSTVITTMMKHDQALKSAWATTSQPAANTAAEVVATAPTYINQPQAATPQETQPVYVSNNYFYDTLSPYGTWIEIDGYGRCWRPTVAITSSSWQPYRDRGRWVHTDVGWYWMSDYSWGSVAFHYGRWFSHPRWGWCWWPDTVWAPSWVTWRYDNAYCGWAPLPPRSYYRSGVGFVYHDRSVGLSFDFGLSVGAFTFVPWGRFSDPYPYRYCLPRSRSVAIYNQTTIINNVVIGNDNTIINRGISTDRVREHSRTEVRTVSLRTESDRTASPRQERFERDGRTLVVSRPKFVPGPVDGPSIPPGERSSGRIAPTRAAESVVVTPTTPISNGRPQISGGKDRRETVVPRESENRAIGRSVSPNLATPANPSVVTSPTTPIRAESRSSRERPSSETAVRIPEATTTPTPARTPTPIFSKPVVVERPAYTPTRTIAPPAAPAPSGFSSRENSIWSSPAARPQPSAPASAPSYRTTPSRSQTEAVVDNSRQIQNARPIPSAPTYNRPSIETRSMERTVPNNLIDRSSRGRSEVRSVAPTFSSPAPRMSAPVIAPTPTPAPAPTLRPSYSPPAASVIRVEPQAAPARPEPRSEAQSESGRPGRNR